MRAWTDHLPEILNERIQIFHEDRYRDIVKREGQWRATVRVQRHGPGAKTTEVEARVALVCASTDDGRPLTGGANLIWTVVDYSLFHACVATLAALAGRFQVRAMHIKTALINAMKSSS